MGRPTVLCSRSLRKTLEHTIARLKCFWALPAMGLRRSRAVLNWKGRDRSHDDAFCFFASRGGIHAGFGTRRRTRAYTPGTDPRHCAPAADCGCGAWYFGRDSFGGGTITRLLL